MKFDMLSSKLTFVILPSTVTSIRARAFYGCVGLVSVVVPDSVEFIDKQVFFGCGKLTITVVKGSFGEEYCRENKIDYNTNS